MKETPPGLHIPFKIWRKCLPGTRVLHSKISHEISCRNWLLLHLRPPEGPEGSLGPPRARRALGPFRGPRTLGAQRQLSRNNFCRSSFMRIYTCAVKLGRVDGQARSAIRIMFKFKGFFIPISESLFFDFVTILAPKTFQYERGLAVGFSTSL